MQKCDLNEKKKGEKIISKEIIKRYEIVSAYGTKNKGFSFYHKPERNKAFSETKL